jgi:hypothetical protein
MASVSKLCYRLHQLSKWCVVLGLALSCATASVHTAERTTGEKLDVLLDRAARYRQTEYAERYQSHALRAEKRLHRVQALDETWGNPVPGAGLLLLGIVMFALTPSQTEKPRRVRPRKRSRDRHPPARRRARPAETQPQTTHSETPRTPTLTLLGRGTG